MALFCSYCGSENSTGATACEKCDARIGHFADENPYAYEATDETTDKQSGGAMSSPLFWLATAGICGLYLVNPGAGVLEFIPDNFPIVGNLDEAAATTGLLLALAKLGLNPFAKTETKK